jgi:hypothetical protein
VEAGALLFSQAARRLGAAARAAGLAVPAFRCPPRIAGAHRTIRRYPGGAVVAVRLRDRPFAEVASDMVEGVLAVNRLDETAAARMRPLLHQAVDSTVDHPVAA